MYRPPNVDILTDWALNTELKNVKGHGPADQRIDHVRAAAKAWAGVPLLLGPYCLLHPMAGLTSHI